MPLPRTLSRLLGFAFRHKLYVGGEPAKILKKTLLLEVGFKAGACGDGAAKAIDDALFLGVVGGRSLRVFVGGGTAWSNRCFDNS